LKTFNKKGDKGETSLLFGRRVPKSDLHCEAYGTIDEVVSALGIARNYIIIERLKDILLKVQKELFTINGELATKSEDYNRFSSSFTPINFGVIDTLESNINELEAEIEMPKAFVIPGATIASSWLDFSRAIIRRAERAVVRLKEKNELRNELILQYLNRLADLLFTMARYEEAKRE
jgi:cob(I)alamin adenosyltransferase